MTKATSLIACFLVCFAQSADPAPPKWLSKIPVKFRTKGETRKVYRHEYEGSHKCTSESDPFRPKGECIGKDDPHFSKSLSTIQCGACVIAGDPKTGPWNTWFCAENTEQNNTLRYQYAEYKDDKCHHPNDWDFSDMPEWFNLLPDCDGYPSSCKAFCDGPPASRSGPGCPYRGSNDEQECNQNRECSWKTLPFELPFSSDYYTIEDATVTMV